MSCDWSPNSCNLKAEYIPTFEAPYQTWFPTIDRSKGYCPVVREKEQNLSAGVIINPTCPEGKPSGSSVHKIKVDFKNRRRSALDRL